jgi:hypothetical protein
MIDAFIKRWQASAASERANYQLFLTELCAVLEVEPPQPAGSDEALNAYVFEKSVRFPNRDGSFSLGRIDLYKRGFFVLEAKQGANDGDAKPGHGIRGSEGWDQSMVRAKNQAEKYVRALPAAEGRPPFLLVADVGHAIEIYSEFTRTGGIYIPFPDASCHRILIRDLCDPALRERLRRVWTDPASLDPSLRSARVTREISGKLAELARSLEASGHAPEAVGGFLMRCIFTMFAEDVGLLPQQSFSRLIASLRDSPGSFQPIVEELWKTMDKGGFSIALREKLLCFNGGFFEERRALTVTPEQIDLLVAASRADWRDVEPAIFGTLLERALDTRERHRLGAHYTPRAYVERLVLPAVIEPLRTEWESVQAAVSACLASEDRKTALSALHAFHRRLCAVRVLDPACGSGNFLYVTLEHLKRLEAETLGLLATLGETERSLDLQGHTVHPAQFLGLELNPRAAVLAELCLWIGYLQWHLRTRGKAALAEPVISKFHTIENRDAVLACDRIEPRRDAANNIVTQWDGRTFKRHPVTGEDVPDETVRRVVFTYVNPRPAEWPAADFIVGNPPFIGTARMRDALGDGYAETLRALYPDVPESADFVMYWWHKAACLVREGRAERFGFITTNSLRQTFNRRVLEVHLQVERSALNVERSALNVKSCALNVKRFSPLSLLFAIPDHPWVENADSAAVRIAMTVAALQQRDVAATLQTVIAETEGSDGAVEVTLATRTGTINADLTIGADVAGAGALKANKDISNPGVKLHGAGFIVTREEAAALGLGRIPGLEHHIREYRNGKDLANRPRDVLVIDLFGLTEIEVRDRFPEVYQWVYNRVKPERDINKREVRKKNWWIFGEPNMKLRSQLEGLPHYIATGETSKHRFFQFLDAEVLPDNMLVCIAHDDAYVLGVLSSSIHVTWALAAGTILGPTPRYNKTRCFEPFPFPDATEEQKACIRDLAERLDAHRKRQLALHPSLTMTDMYNVLEAVRAEETLTAKQKAIHEQGLIIVLRQLHDELDAAVAAAYGWKENIQYPTRNDQVGSGENVQRSTPNAQRLSLSDEEILTRLVALNKQRADEESRGHIRYLRPAYQHPFGVPASAGDATVQSDLGLPTNELTNSRTNELLPLPWPESLADQIALVRGIIHQTAWQPADGVKSLVRYFSGVRAPTVQRLVDALAALGHVG